METENTEKQNDEQSEDYTVAVTLDDADELMYDQLVGEFGPELIAADVREVVKERVRQLYDNRDMVAKQLQEEQRQAAFGGQ